MRTNHILHIGGGHLNFLIRRRGCETPLQKRPHFLLQSFQEMVLTWEYLPVFYADYL